MFLGIDRVFAPLSMFNSNTNQTEMNNSSQSLPIENAIAKIQPKIQKQLKLREVWNDKFHKGLNELFDMWLYESYEEKIKFYRGIKDRKRFLKSFKEDIQWDYSEHPQTFITIWENFKEWYDFRCHMIYQTFLLSEKSYQ